MLEAGLEPAWPQWPKDFKSFVSTIPPFERMVRRLRTDLFGKVNEKMPICKILRRERSQHHLEIIAYGDDPVNVMRYLWSPYLSDKAGPERGVPQAKTS